MKAVIAAIVVTAAGSLMIASADVNDDYELIAQAAAERPASSAQPGTAPAHDAGADVANELGQSEQEARIDLTLAQTRLELILARKALRAQDHQGAASRAQRVLGLLKELPAEIDASVYELQAEGILARAAKAGVDVNALAQRPAGEQPVPAFGHPPQDQAHAPRKRPRSDYSYRPGREILDTKAILARDRRRSSYEAALHAAYKDDETRLLMAADEARVVPKDDIAYPDDWPDRVARRAKYAGGEVARSESWIDKDGNEWYVAVYDIRDLTYVPPDFQPSFSLDPVEDLRNTLDRDALRWRSGIFNGYYPYDLWEAIPLLRYFGGVDDFAFRGPKYSAERQQQIVEMIEAFTTQSTESKIIPLAP